MDHEPVPTKDEPQTQKEVTSPQEMTEVDKKNDVNQIPAVSNASTGGSAFSLAVSWENLKYTVDTGKKREDGTTEKIEILKGLTGCALPGRTLAIMGSSGAGKTTFLNALSDRLRSGKQHILEGSTKLNDVPYARKYRQLMGYVTQDDTMNQMSTPTDLFSFSLRIRRGATKEATKVRVDEMIEELNLGGAKDTVVGVPGLVVGLSGGERKRANIGVELIADPKVLFLDEPTSGLDAVTSSKVINLCKDLAARGRTVIYTIHQPTADCVAAFQDLMLMCQGYCVYHGTMEDSVAYFSALGYNCPEHFTPTDYYMTLLQDEEIGAKLVVTWTSYLEGGHNSAHNTAGAATPALTSPQENAGVGAVAAAGAAESNNVETKVYLDNYVQNHGSSLGIQFSELFNRSFTNIGRNKMYIAMSITQSVFFALVAGIIFWQLTDDVQGIQDRMGVMFMIVANRCFSGAMMMINTFPPEKEVFIREQAGGSYSPAVYFLAKSFSELPVQAIGVILESGILYFMCGFVVDASRFFTYLVIVFALFQGSTGLGMLVSCAVDSFQLASGLAPLLIIPMMLAGGLLGSVDRLRWGWVWLEKISIVRYGFMLIAVNEFEGVDNIGCNPSDFPGINGTSFCANQPTNGKQVLQNFDFTGYHHEPWVLWLSLIAWIVMARLGCVWALNRVAKSKM